MTKFKVGDKVRVIVTNEDFPYGTEGVVCEPHYDGACGGNVRVRSGSRRETILGDHLELISEQSRKQTKSERIDALEAEVLRLHERLLDIESGNASVRIPRKHGKSDFVEELLTPKSPNEQRKAIIAEAKAFVAEHERRMGYTVAFPFAHFDRTFTVVNFVVNAEKRTVVALVTPKFARDGKRVLTKGIAKAHPDDVFNVDIGKAIALGRALGIDVTRFEKAAQPTEYVRGQVVTFPKDDSLYRKRNYRIDTVKDRDSDLTMLFQPYAKAFGGNMTRGIGYEDADENSLPVIDDTKAQY